MVREGVFDDPRPEAVFGLHALANLPVGQVGFTEGPALAAVDLCLLFIHPRAPNLINLRSAGTMPA